MRLPRTATLLIALLASCTAPAIAPAARADGTVLWRLVSKACVPNQLAHHDPAPCVLVHLDDGIERGWAVLKDIRGVSQFLLIPTAKLTGIESPELLAPDGPNYFAAAWSQHDRVGAALGHTLRRQDIALAINSRLARSQEQLHIHIDCIRPDVRDLIAQHQGELTSSWQPFPVPLVHHRYFAMRLKGDTLSQDPFRLVAARLHDPATEMARQTLVLAGADFPDGPGFVLLDGEVRLLHGDLGGGEDLQDHRCRLAH